MEVQHSQPGAGGDFVLVMLLDFLALTGIVKLSILTLCAQKVWLARWPGITPTEKTPEWEEGLYQYFDHRCEGVD